ncbi:MAG: transcriptional regulator [Epulopiscium sp.]|nr:transcriptional regulator [Candidatus Epulonipiscium sp.]
MKQKIGVIGPIDLTAEIIEVGQKYPQLSFTSYSYENEQEALGLARKAIRNKMETLLFTGPIPYQIVKQAQISDIPMRYVSYSGTGFYKVLIEYFKDHSGPHKPLNFSIDTLSYSAVVESLKECSINYGTIYAQDYEVEEQPAFLVDFHLKLYKENKIDFAITSLTSAYQKLKEMNVPVYRITPTQSSIKEALRFAILQGDSLRFQKAQLCVGIVEITNWNQMDQYSPSEYEQQRMLLGFTQQFVDFCEEIKASMKIEKENRFTFYTNKGSIEEVTQGYKSMPLLENIKEKFPFHVGIGLGYGYSANEAQKNGEEALKYAVYHGHNQCFVILEDGKVIGPLDEERKLEYYPKTENAELIARMQDSNISIGSINRVSAVMDKRGRDTITVNQLAEELNITLRSARRILSRLVESNLMEVVGEEQPAGPGRPRQVFKFI